MHPHVARTATQNPNRNFILCRAYSHIFTSATHGNRQNRRSSRRYCNQLARTGNNGRACQGEYGASRAGNSGSPTLVPRVLEQLIVVKLQLQEAESLGITIDEIALDELLTKIAADNGKTLAEMKAEIERNQGSYSEMRESVRQEFIISQLRQSVVGNIAVSENEIEAKLREINAQTLFRFSYLAAELPDDESEREELTRWFQNLRLKMLNENDFYDIAEQAAKRTSVNYKRSQPRRLNQLPELLQEKVLDMNIGDITSVIRTADTLYLFSLDDRQAEQLPQIVEKQYRIRHILLRSDAMYSDSYIRKNYLPSKSVLKTARVSSVWQKNTRKTPVVASKAATWGGFPPKVWQRNSPSKWKMRRFVNSSDLLQPPSDSIYWKCWVNAGKMSATKYKGEVSLRNYAKRSRVSK